MKKIRIKKIIVISSIIILLLMPTLAKADTFSDESWIAAYYYKKTLTPNEKYLPFIYIREHNKPFKNNVGACIRLIEADFILLQQLPLYNLINKRYEEGFTFQNTITKVFDEINSKEEYISKIYQLAALTVFQEEITESYNRVKTVYPKEFYYRFYHIYISEYETLSTTARNDYVPKNTKYTAKINSIRNKTFYGIYDTPIEKIPYEIPESIIATERINGLMPIKAEDYIYMYESPLISAERTVYDENTKRQYGIENINLAHSIEIKVHTIDKELITKINESIQDYTPEILEYVKSRYESKFGSIDTSQITKETLRDYLLANRPEK